MKLFRAKLLKRFFVLMLIFALAGCGKPGAVPGEESGTSPDTEGQVSGPKELYALEELTMEIEPWSYAFVRQIGDYLYYFALEDEDGTGTSGYRFYRYSASDGSTQQVTERIAGNQFPQCFDVGEDGSVCGTRFNQGTCLFMKYSAAGEEIYCENLSKVLPGISTGEIGDAVAVFCDSDGGVCLVCKKLVLFFDGEGRYVDSLDPRDGSQEALVECAGRGEDGKIYIKLMDTSATPGKTDILLEVDPADRTFDVLERNFYHKGPISTGIKKGFLLNCVLDNTVYDYDAKSQNKEALFSWKDYGLFESVDEYIYSLGVTSDGKILAVLVNWETGKESVLLFFKTVDNKEEIVLGTVDGQPMLRDAVAKFNKMNDKYHISIKDYLEGQEWSSEAAAEGWTRMELELVSGGGPDIIDLGRAQMQTLGRQGVLEDLEPYLGQSGVISRGDFVGRVLEGATYDGKLVALPKQFQMFTVVGRSRDVGADAGWTLEEFMGLVESRPGVQVLNRPGKAELFRFCTSYNLDAFVDREKGKCNFDSPEFIRLLKFADRYGDVKADSGEDSYEAYLEGMQHGEILLNETTVMKFSEIQLYDEFFEGDACMVGYPTIDGSAAHYFVLNGICGISANSQHKEGAWKFLESYVTTEIKKDEYDFSALTGCLEKQIQAELADVKYQVDEDGKALLDENGDPIPAPSHSDTYGTWRFDYHTPTAEEAERIKSLIRTARPLPAEDAELWTIVSEEAEAFFHGSKSAEQVADVIQRRAQLYVSEG